MIEFYADYYNAESFTEEYKVIDTYNLSIKDSAGLIEILLDYGMYYEARQLIDHYGYMYVSAPKLLCLWCMSLRHRVIPKNIRIS